MMQLNNVHYCATPVCILSEVDVGNLHIAIYLQHVDLVEAEQAVGVVAQVLPVHKHFVLLAPAANGHLRNTDRKINKSKQQHDHEGAI